MGLNDRVTLSRPVIKPQKSTLEAISKMALGLFITPINHAFIRINFFSQPGSDKYLSV